VRNGEKFTLQFMFYNRLSVYLAFGVAVSVAILLGLLTYTESLQLAGQGFNPGWEQVARVKPWGTIYGINTLRGIRIGTTPLLFLYRDVLFWSV
jgi:hypothetical protein